MFIFQQYAIQMYYFIRILKGNKSGFRPLIQRHSLIELILKEKIPSS